MAIEENYIEARVNEYKCPEPMFCTVATTGYTPGERKHACMMCWFEWCKRNNIEVIYDAGFPNEEPDYEYDPFLSGPA